MINWLDIKSKINPYFTVKEAIWLPSWSRIANEGDGLNDEVKANLETLFNKLQVIREFINKPFNVHVTYRPTEYNALIGGAKNSTHVYGMACDFSVNNLDCDSLRQLIIDNKFLETLFLRMEDLPKSNWVHLDIREPGPAGRFFKP